MPGKRQLNNKQRKELDFSKAFSLYILAFIGKATPSNSPRYHEQFEQVVQQTYIKNDLRGMRLLVNDIIEWAKGMSKQQVEELNLSLIEKFARNLNSYSDQKKIKAIITKGEIRSINEYELISRYMKEIHEFYMEDDDDENKYQEIIKALDQLITTYYLKSGKK